jgi:beta-glucosidase-like glycosyl hydrolase
MAIAAGEDMLAFCANTDSYREGYRAILDAVQSGEISEARIDESLGRIAHLKSNIQPPLAFDAERLQFLSDNISQLHSKISEDTKFV